MTLKAGTSERTDVLYLLYGVSVLPAQFLFKLIHASRGKKCLTLPATILLVYTTLYNIG